MTATLEILVAGAATPAHQTPLLFVHGTSHAAWCWDEHFLPYFAEHGYRCAAVSLRGHGRSPMATSLRRVSLSEFAEDLRSAVDQLGATPVLIGHSLGGFVIIKYLQRHEARGVVLAASAPPYGSWATVSRAIRHHPRVMLNALLRGRLGPDFSAPELARSWFFSPDLAPDLLARYASRLQPESDRALLGCLLPRPVRPRGSVPMLVLAGQDDFVFSPRDTAASARAFGADWHLIPNLAHDVMLDTRWRAAADAIRVWLGRHGF